MLLSPDTLPLYQASRARCCCGGSGVRECTRHITLPAPSCSPHHARGAAAALLALCCCLSGVTFARGVGLRWRQFLLGHRSHRADLHNPIDLSVRVRCPWGMYALKPVRRGGIMGSGATLPQLRARKVVFIPLLIPQPDWDKSHFFSGLSHI